MPPTYNRTILELARLKQIERTLNQMETGLFEQPYDNLVDEATQKVSEAVGILERYMQKGGK